MTTSYPYSHLPFVTVYVAKPGLLKDSENFDLNISNLKITGKINKEDFATIKSMPNIKHLDLSQANIKEKAIPAEAFTYDADIYGCFRRPECPHKGYFNIENCYSKCTIDDLWGLKSVLLPDDILRIKQKAFDGCKDFEYINFPDSITEIGVSAFRYCSRLESEFKFPANIKKIRQQAFNYCYKLKGEMTMPDTLVEIGKGAFSDCHSMTGTPRISKNLKKFPEGMFYHCSGLTGNLDIPEGVEQIDGSTFAHCSGLSGSLSIPKSVKTIDHYAFSYCSFEGDLKIPKSIEHISFDAFKDMPKIRSLWIEWQFDELPEMVDIYTICLHMESIKLMVPKKSLTQYQEYFEYRYKKSEAFYGEPGQRYGEIAGY